MRKLKKALSLSLALVLSLSLAVPALAAGVEKETAEIIEGFTLTGIVSEEETPGSPPLMVPLYKVEFPAAFVISGCGAITDQWGWEYRSKYFAEVYETTQTPDESGKWEYGPDYFTLPDQWVAAKEFTKVEWTENGVYAFDESYAGRTIKVLVNQEFAYNEENRPGGANVNRATGMTEFLIQFPESGSGNSAVSPAEPEQPTTPIEPSQPEQPTTPTTPEQPTTPPVEPAKPDAPGTYTVKKGDTWSSICINFYGNNSQRGALQKANKGVALKEGAVIVLPEKLGKDTLISAPAAGAGEKLYTVRAGDTLGKIAAAEYGKASEYKAIFERNADRLKNANTIYEGQVIVLPAK